MGQRADIPADRVFLKSKNSSESVVSFHSVNFMDMIIMIYCSKSICEFVALFVDDYRGAATTVHE